MRTSRASQTSRRSWRSTVSYAGKALLLVALARRLAASPLGLDVCSLGELLTAERANFPAARLVMHGCAKTDAELAAVASGRVGRIVIDNAGEIARLAAVARASEPVSVLLRVNTVIEAHTHAHVRTGGEDSKFGLAPSDVPAASEAVLAAPGLRLAGFHSHLGSQIFERPAYGASLPLLIELHARAVAAGAPATDLVIGGGFGIPARPSEERFDVTAMLREIVREVARACRTASVRPPRLGIEPGRAIVAEAGTSLYRVAVVKRQGTRRFAIVDGGIADNPRPAFVRRVPRAVARGPGRRPPRSKKTTVCGRSCENDQLVVAPLPADLRAGDVLALGTTGAYTYSMASNYNRFPKPAVVFAGGGSHRLVARRETSEDVLRNDVDDVA